MNDMMINQRSSIKKRIHKVTGLHVDMFDNNWLLCTMIQLAPVSKITSVGGKLD